MPIQQRNYRLWFVIFAAVILTVTSQIHASSVSVELTHAPSSVPTDSIALTPIVKERLDTTVSPCQDFYQYVNGGWITNARDSIRRAVPQRAVVYNGTLMEMAKRAETMLRLALESAAQKSIDTSDTVIDLPTRLIGVYYASCLAYARQDSTTVLAGVGATSTNYCIADAKRQFGEAAAHAYVHAVLGPTERAQIDTIAATIRSAFAARLQARRWMQDTTRRYAIAKLAAMQFQFGTAPKMPDYSLLKLSPSNYRDNVRAVSAWRWQRKVAQIGETPDRTAWYFSVYEANATNRPDENRAEIPAAILQAPLFVPNGDLATNYGGIGATLGHEMAHGFGAYGRFYGIVGKSNDWWTVRDSLAFIEQTALLLSEYRVISHVPSMPDSTSRLWYILEELQADIGGVNAAYDAFQEHLRVLPVLQRQNRLHGFTPEQRFFIAYANFFRMTDESGYEESGVQPHPLHTFRVNGILAHVPAFARAFGCKEGDPLFRPLSKRLLIW